MDNLLSNVKKERRCDPARFTPVLDCFAASPIALAGG
jgi:hypothetical protein